MPDYAYPHSRIFALDSQRVTEPPEGNTSGVPLVEIMVVWCCGLMLSQSWFYVLIESLGLVDTQCTRVFLAEGLSPMVDRPTGLRMMSSVVSNQDMIREWSDMPEPSWDCVGSPRWIELAN
ncbi:hypothetical protein HAX54_006300 [Datura stramonium]|uniref:Uncharacterized protein n=1 Tax=Datura stramonium TaxID=4076 RepID=A0ABS8TCH1_DATST|nr:hypothetical protein [Datura stramonium]